VSLDAQLEALIRRVIREELDARDARQAAAGAAGEYLSPAEFARRLGVSVPTVRRWIDEGRLEAMRAGRQVRISAAEIERLVRRRAPAERESAEQVVDRILDGRPARPIRRRA
jgi:excisionase family DNA binding protein